MTDLTPPQPREPASDVMREPTFDPDLPGLMEGAELRDSVDAAMEAGDTALANQLKHQEWENMAGSVLQARVQGQDPLRYVQPNARVVSPDVAESVISPQIAQREAARQELLKDDPEVKLVTDLYNSWMDLYRTRNKAPLMKWDPNLPDDQKALLSMQFQKVDIPEEDAQSMLDALWSIDGKMKAIDPNFSVRNEPRLRDIISAMSEAAQPYGPGYFRTAEAPLPEATSAVGRTLRAAPVTLAEGATSLAGFIGNSITSLGLGVIEGFDSDYYQFHRRELEGETYIDRNGNLVHTGAKVGIEGPYLSFKLLQGATVDELQREAEKMHLALQVDRQEVRDGLEYYSNAISMGIGGLASFVATGGTKLMQWGIKGAASLLARGGERIGRLRSFTIQAGGMGLGTAVHEMGMYGRTEGYGRAFVEGMKMGPVFWAAGALGRNVERALAKTRMPAPARRFVSGAFEGMGLSAGEAFNLTSSLWRFMHDPNEETAQEWTAGLVANIFAMGAFKAMTGTTPSQEAALEKALGPEGAALYAARERMTVARRQAVEKAAGDPEAEAALAAEMGVSRETVGRYGQKLREVMEQRMEREQELEAREELERLEEQLDIEQFGGEPGEVRMERQMREREAEAEVRDIPTREEIQRMREMPEGPAKRKAIIEALRAARGGLTRRAAEAITEQLRPQEKAEVREVPREVEPELRAMEMPEAEPGVPKSLQMQRELQMEPTAEFEGKEAPRPRDIIKSLQGLPKDPVQTTIRPGKGGRFSSKGILGWFRSRNNEVRLRGARNLAVAAHEFSHRLDDFFEKKGVMDLRNIPEWMQRQLETAAETYPQLGKLTKLARAREGFAEFWARYQLDDPRLQQEVPELYKHMTDLLRRPELEAVRQQVERNRGLLRQWIGAGELARGRAEIMFEGDPLSVVEKAATPSVRERVSETFTRLMLDDIVELKKAQAKWMKVAELTEADIPITINPPRLIDALRMTAHRQAEEMLRTGTHDLTGRRTGEGVEEILRDIGPENYKDFVQYLVARRGLQYIERGFNTPGTKEGYLYQVSQLETPQFQEGARRIREWANRLLDYAVEGGAFTREEASRMAELNPVYIPFQRITTLPGEPAPRRVRPGRGVAERGPATRGIKGGEYELRDPIEALKDTTKEIITKTHQAMVMKAFYLQSKMIPGLGGLVTEVPRTQEPRQILIDQIAKQLRQVAKDISKAKAKGLRGIKEVDAEALAEQLTELAGGDPAAALTFFFQSSVPRGSRPVVAYRPKFTEAELDRLGIEGKMREEMLADSGKLKWMELDAAAYNAIMSVDAPGLFTDAMPALVQTLIRGPAQVVRFGATIFNPDFIVRNMLRDPLTAQMFTQTGKNRAWVLSGYGQMMLGAAEQLKRTEGAAGFEALGMSGATLMGTEVAREVRRTQYASFGNAVRAVAEVFGKPETWLRVREFVTMREKLRKEGASELDATLEAMLAAKEVTTNFTRAGSLARQINQLIPYFSPAIAGIRKFWRSVLGREGREAQIQSIIRGMVQIGGMSALVWSIHKDDKWYQELPKWRRTRYWSFKVPGTDQIMHIPKPFEPGLLFGTGTELMLQSLHDHDPDLAEQFVVDLVGDHAVGFPWIPAPVKPAAEVFMNYSTFRNRQIVPYWLERSRIPEEQYTAATTELAKAAGAAINVSPAKLEHFFSEATGGMARRLAMSIETIAGINNQAKKMQAVPGVGTLFGVEFKQAASVSKVFDLASELEQKAGSGVLTAAESNMRTVINQAKKRIQDINKMAREGRITKEEASRRAVEVARPVLDRYERAVR